MNEVVSEVVLVKLGGSLITDKRGRESVRAGVLERLSAELREARLAPDCPRVVLAHGSGSFGHIAAAGTPLARPDQDLGGETEALLEASARTQDAAARLHRFVVAAALDAGLPAFSLAPSSFLWREGGELRCGSLEPFLRALDLGMLPICYGDVVMDGGSGASICSTEAVLSCLVDQMLAARRRIREVLWLGETPGVLDSSGGPLRQITEHELEAARAAAGGSSGIDVTGGMKLRLEVAWTLARRGVPSWIVDGRETGALRAALVGAARGTRVWSRQASGPPSHHARCP